MAVAELKSACKWATDNELLAWNPIASVKRPTAKAPTMKVWTPEQQKQFLDATQGDRLYPAWCLLLGLALRRGELCGLRWPTKRTEKGTDELDLESGYIQIETTLIVVDGQVKESTPKTDAGRRRLSLPPELVTVLKAHWAHQAEEKLKARVAYQDDKYVICDELGRPYSPGWISVSFKRAAEAAGLPALKLHGLRHSVITDMLSDGTPLRVVSEFAGHGDPTVTLSVYSHVLPGHADEATARHTAKLFG
jgi:integrase